MEKYRNSNKSTKLTNNNDNECLVGDKKAITQAGRKTEIECVKEEPLQSPFVYSSLLSLNHLWQYRQLQTHHHYYCYCHSIQNKLQSLEIFEIFEVFDILISLTKILTILSIMSNAATPSQAKALYQEPKVKLCEKICLNVNTFGSVAESIIHGKDQVRKSSIKYKRQGCVV